MIIMAHRSEDSTPLSGKEIQLREWNELRNLKTTEKDVHLFHLDTESPYSTAEIEEIVSNLNPVLLKMAAPSVVCFLVSPENALHLIPEIQKSLHYKLWISVRRENPIAKENDLANAHMGLIIFTKYSTALKHCKTQIDWDTRYREANILKQWYCTRATCLKKRNSAGITDREELTDLWWDIHRLKHNSKRVDHPCQLPPQLMRRLISLYTREGEFVLDPFNGAGTTTLVAQELGRKYIGFELSEYYHQIALNRHEELEAGIDPFAKRKYTPTAKNSRVKRMKKQKYAVPKKTLQLEVKRIAEEIGRIPTREDVKAHSQYPFHYFEEYFIDWGEVCSAVGDKGMNEAPELEYETPKYTQLTLFERRKRYALEIARNEESG